MKKDKCSECVRCKNVLESNKLYGTEPKLLCVKCYLYLNNCKK